MKTINNKIFTAYSCASPIRLPVIQAVAGGSSVSNINAEPNPNYQGNNSIVWGLIRGAKEIMDLTSANGCDFFHVDNAYYGRNLYFRVTHNALQLSSIPRNVIDDRYKKILKILNKTIHPWKRKRNGPIVICPSSHFLYSFYSTNLEEWIAQTISTLKKYTDRPIKIRYKKLMPDDDIDQDIMDAWCVVTHVSASCLDALRLGIPIITTGTCSGSPLSTPIDKVESPLLEDGRDQLFSYLAWGQFTIDEMKNTNVLDISSQIIKRDFIQNLD
jgi:hypothetical protein